jgi:hypothetical protein
MPNWLLLTIVGGEVLAIVGFVVWVSWPWIGPQKKGK